MLLRHARQLSSTMLEYHKTLTGTLDGYFANTKFHFSNPNHVRSLRHWMELVYLRKRPLVAIDIEAWEQDSDEITEIGLAIYDPRGQETSLVPRIRTCHILIEENLELTNGRYVPNNKFRFNGGRLYEMSADQSKQFLDEILAHYFGGHHGVLVGHNVKGDLQWLAHHGVAEVDHIATVDTEKLHHILRQGGGSLRGLLRTVNIPHLNLHNAANDAYYTLLAAMSYCDPEQRRIFGLDVYQQTPQVAMDKRAKAAQKRREKFTDTADVVPAHEAPDAYELINELRSWGSSV